MILSWWYGLAVSKMVTAAAGFVKYESWSLSCSE